MRLILAFIMTILTSSVLASDYPYDKKWEEVMKLLIEHPQKAKADINEIEQHAKTDKAVGQQLKCIFTRDFISTDKGHDTTLLSELKRFAEAQKDMADRLFSKYILSKALEDYYRKVRWSIMGRSEIKEYIPEDIKEWSNNIFRDSIQKLREEVLTEADLLYKYSPEYYKPIVTTGKDSRTFRPTLLDFICYDIIENSKENEPTERKKLYKKLIALHEQNNNINASFYVKTKQIEDSTLSNEEKYAEYTKLINKYGDYEASNLARTNMVEILINYIKREEDSEEAETKQKFLNINLNDIPQEVIRLKEEGEKKFPNSILTKSLTNEAKKIYDKYLTISTEKAIFRSDEPIKLKINYANIDEINVFLHNNIDEKHTSKKVLSKWTIPLEKSNYTIQKTTTYEIPAQKYGRYSLSIKCEGIEKKYQEYIDFSVSDLFCISEYHHCPLQKQYNQSFIIVESKMGAPLNGAEVHISNATFSKKGKTNKDGVAIVNTPQKGSVIIHYKNGEDKFLQERKYYWYYGNSSNSPETKFWITTDRTIYRPGQTIFFKAIVYQDSVGNTQPCANHSVEATLYDRNRQKIETKQLTTNPFGSVSDSFVVPTGSLNGEFRIEVSTSKYKSESKYFRVEEYKRPTFDITIERPKGTYTYGDKITFDGNAKYLTGIPLSNIKITYSISKKRYLFYPENPITNGEVFTDSEGNFSATFITEDDDKFPYYTITVKTTDDKGESHEASQVIAIGKQSLIFKSHSNKLINTEKSTDKLFSVRNLYDDVYQTNVSYSISKNGNVLYSAKSHTDKDGFINLSDDLKNIESGEYKLQMNATDEFGRECKESFDVIIFKTSDRRPPIFAPLWTDDGACKEGDDNNANETRIDWGKKISLRVGSSLPEANLLCIEETESGKENASWHKLNNENRNFDFTFTEADGCGKHITFILVSNGKCYTLHREYVKKEKERTLDLQLTTFRDKIEPGSEELWTLNVKGGSKTEKKEVLAEMYDKTLDLIYSPLSWHQLNISHEYSPEFRKWRPIDIEYNNRYNYDWWNNESKHKYYFLSFDRFLNIHDDTYERKNSRHTQFASKNSIRIRGISSISADGIGQEEAIGATVALNDVATIATSDSDEESEEEIYSEVSEGSKFQKPQIRKKFEETAFFYPFLITDAEGNVTIKFKVPDSNTQWRFLAFANDEKMNSGILSQNIISRKQLMITPNLPRFLRTGDKCELSAKIDNFTEQDINGEAELKIIDATTGKLIFTGKNTFSAKNNSSTPQFWSVEIPYGVEAAVVVFTCSAGNVSDGEQHLVPILSNETIVTQAINMAVRGNTKKQFTFDQLAKGGTSAKTRFMKVEFTSNPIWLAIQALPSLSLPAESDAISLAIGRYANIMSSHIVNSDSKIAEVISAWAKKYENGQNLVSTLEKNPKVKEILLNETPWVRDAKNEAERKNRLATLIDLKKSEKALSQIEDQLHKLQNKDGSYSWWNGMDGSFYVTTCVLELEGYLKHQNIKSKTSRQDIQKAISFLDHKLKEYFDQAKKWNHNKTDKIGLTESIIHYLDVRSAFPDIKIPQNSKQAYDHYYTRLKQYWLTDLSLYGKAAAASIFERNKDHNFAQRIVDHLRELSQNSEEEGMHWSKNTASYFWYQRPVITQSRLISAFAEVDYKAEEIDDMRTWLLNQKRTQEWESPLASANAVHALTAYGSKWTSTEDNLKVSVGGQNLESESGESAIGQISKTFAAEEVDPTLANISVENDGKSIAWGGAYWQFSDKLSNIQKSKSGLHIEKTVMKKVTEEGRTIIVPISNDNLSVGDKLTVRLTLRADRDYDFVCLKDQRASCLEPTTVISRYTYAERVGYYETTKDASTQFFFYRLPQGTYVFEYDLWITHSGTFSNGIATAQCIYAPEFVSNSDETTLKVHSKKTKK